MIGRFLRPTSPENSSRVVLPFLTRLDQNASSTPACARRHRSRRKPCLRRRARQQLRLMQLHRLELLHRLRRIFLRVEAASRHRLPPERQSTSAAAPRFITNSASTPEYARCPSASARRDRSSTASCRSARDIPASPAAAGRRCGRCAHARAPRRIQLRSHAPEQRQMRIDLAGLLSVSLKQAAVQQNVLSRTFQMVRRTRDRLRRTPEMQPNPHALVFPPSLSLLNAQGNHHITSRRPTTTGLRSQPTRHRTSP